MNSLKKKLIMAVTVALLAVNANAGIDLQSINVDEPLPAATAHQLLDKVILHNPAVLDTMNVEISDMQHRGLFSVVFAYVGRGKSGFPTEIYVVTVDKKGNFIDGALLGMMGDVRNLVIDRDPEMQYRPNTGISYDLTDDTIKVKRTYSFFTTQLGGRYMHKDGEIFNPFVLKADGTLKQLPAYTTAIMQEGHAPLPGKEELPTRTATKGDYYGYGMNVLQLMQTPVSAFDMEKVNDLAKWAAQTNARPKSTDAFNVHEIALWAPALCMRHASDALTWIARNHDAEMLSGNILEQTKYGIYGGEKTWLEQCVKNLKDKKARKWWQGMLKKVN